MLDGVMEDVTDGVWLFGKDSFEECPLTKMWLRPEPLLLSLLLLRPQLRGKTPLRSQKNSEQFTFSSTEGGLHGDPLC